MANLKYYMWPKFKQRCIQVHRYVYDKPNVKNNAIILSILRMVYAKTVLSKTVNWMDDNESII